MSSAQFDGAPVEFWLEQVVAYGLEDHIFDSERWRDMVYILGALFFSIAIFGFRHPSSANMGNFYAFLGMMAAIGSTLGSAYCYGNGYYVFIGFIPAAIVAGIMAFKVKMTSMPQMVGLLNALGGLAAALESFSLYVSPLEEVKFSNAMKEPFGPSIDAVNGYFQGRPTDLFATYDTNAKRFQIYNAIFYILGMIIGTITFTGSLTACLKLAGKIPGKAFRLPARVPITAAIVVLMFALAIIAAVLGIGNSPLGIILFGCSAAVAALYGVLFVICIGGADMPVVISVLNSLSGWSTVFAGLTFNNSLMIIAGTFVGASGIILSVLMCNAMNRKLSAVLLGDMGSASPDSVAVAQIDAHLADAELCAKYLAGSKTVYIIPGYGMAVSRAQHVVASLADALRHSGRECRFAAHPVAGRLPGHMNVLLSEASVPYDTVDDLDHSNPKFKETDTCIVIGANDTVNPAAVFDKGSPIYGMPVLECWNAKRTIVIKRSLNMGYAGIENPLFFSPNTSMLLGDGKAVMEQLLEAFKTKAGTVKPTDISRTTVQFISAEETRVNDRQEAQDRLRAAEAADAESSEEEVANHVLCETPSRCVVGVLREPVDFRTYLVPKDVEALVKKDWNIKVIIEKDAGKNAGFSDAEYINAGAAIGASPAEVISNSHILLKILPPTVEEVTLAAERSFVAVNKHVVPIDVMIDTEQSQTHVKVGLEKPLFISAFGNPSKSTEIQELCRENGVSFFSSDIMPRVTAAQAMDVLSSSAKVAGYRAVLEACSLYGRLPGQEITAAGSYPPAKALVVGVGVAGLQAIGDCNRMGMDVRAFDVRKECADQVASMGGKFLLLDFDEDGAAAGGYANIMSPEFIAKEMELFTKQCEEVDIIITTAAIPGRRAPILLKGYHIELMKKGSVVIDLAAPTGGNVEITKPDQNWTTPNGVKMVGKVDFVSTVSAPISSDMLSGNIINWFTYCMKKSNNLSTVDMSDGIIRAIALSHSGKKCWPAPRPPAPPTPPQKAQVVVQEEDIEDIVISKCSKRSYCFGSNLAEWVLLIVFIVFFVVVIFTAPDEFLGSMMVIILGAWTGFLLVNNVTSALHTPLMSLTNAISGVVILAGILACSEGLVQSSDVFDYVEKLEFFAQYVAPVAGTPQAATPLTADNICDPDSSFNKSLVAGFSFAATSMCSERGLASIILNGTAIFAASLNVVGGFGVTKRMLSMFVSS